MITDLTDEQKGLADYMSTLSEEAFSAGWMKGLEYALWEAMNGELSEYGRLKFTESHRQKLRELSQQIEGWIVFDEHKEEVFIPLALWKDFISQSEN